MKNIHFRSFRIKCTQNSDLYFSTQRVEVKYLVRSNLGQLEQVPLKFTCGFRNNSERCTMCQGRVFSLVSNGCDVPEDSVVMLDQVCGEFPPND
jgi:hypothetical protein